MSNGKCPMCGSSEVYRNRTLRFFTSNTKLYLRDEDGNIGIGAGFIPYVCADCGFTALYVKEMNDIKNLASAPGWEKAAG